MQKYFSIGISDDEKKGEGKIARKIERKAQKIV